MTSPVAPQIVHFFDTDSSTFSYVVYAHTGGECAIIDSVLGYELRSGRTSTAGADQIAAFVQAHGLQVQWHLETHVHADHLSAAAYLRRKLGGKIAMSARIGNVRQAFHHAFNLGDPGNVVAGAAGAAGAVAAPDFDHLFNDGDRFTIGPLQARVLAVPGHTPADLAYVVQEQSVFVGDTLFMPDVGSARCDFPGGDPVALFASVRKLLALAPQTELYMCHDYPPPTRGAMHKSTVMAQRAHNIHMHDGVGVDDFVAMRTRRDATLALPQLIVPSLQVNMHAGELPRAEANGVRYLKIPLDVF